MTVKLYEVTLIGTFFGQEVVNRFNYQGNVSGVASGDAFGLVSAMGLVPVAGAFPASTLGAALQALVSDGLDFNQVIARAVYDPFDFVDVPFIPVASGAQGGDDSPTFVAFGFRSNRVRQDIGRGFKRFAGVSEGLISSFGVLGSTAITLADLLAGELTSTLTYTESSLTDTFTPVVVGKLKYTTPSGKEAYKYYSTEVLQADHLALGVVWEPYPSVRSQVSRQVGKGK